MEFHNFELHIWYFTLSAAVAMRLWKALLVLLSGIIEEEDSSAASLFFQKEEVQLWCKVQSWGSSFVS